MWRRRREETTARTRRAEDDAGFRLSRSAVPKGPGGSLGQLEAALVRRKERPLSDPRDEGIFDAAGDLDRLVAGARVHDGLEPWGAIRSFKRVLPEEQRTGVRLDVEVELGEASGPSRVVLVQIQDKGHDSCPVREAFIIMVVFVVDMRLVVLAFFVLEQL